jgi:hypothetical protein
MASAIKRPDDSSSIYAPPWARGAEREKEQPFNLVESPFGVGHTVAELKHRFPLEPHSDHEKPADYGRMGARMMALQMCAVSGFAALVAWAFVSLTVPKPIVDRSVRLNQTASSDGGVTVRSAEVRRQTMALPLVGNGAMSANPRLPDPGVSTTLGSRPAPVAQDPAAEDRAPVAEALASPATHPLEDATTPATSRSAPTLAKPVTASAINPSAPRTVAANAVGNIPAEAPAIPSTNIAPTQTFAVPAARNDPSSSSQSNVASTGPQPGAPRSVDKSVVPSADDMEAFLNRGRDLINAGDFVSARLVLRRAVDAGSAEAALALGTTYDPIFIKEVQAVGIEPDINRAREWYQKAVELGSPLAAKKLANLLQAR